MTQKWLAHFLVSILAHAWARFAAALVLAVLAVLALLVGGDG
ncbi:MAG: hypothetical protein AAGE80_05605 [Pseudomonadota bacterium]